MYELESLVDLWCFYFRFALLDDAQMLILSVSQVSICNDNAIRWTQRLIEVVITCWRLIFGRGFASTSLFRVVEVQ